MEKERHAPIHVVLSEAIHDTCRSKKLNGIMSYLGFFFFFEELEKTDTALV